MTHTNLYVKSYEYELSLSDSRNAPRAVLYLYGDGRKLVAAVALEADGNPLPPARITDDGLVLASVSADQLPRIVDMLRHEKPIILCWDASTGSLRLTTGAEPVGEEELKRLFSWLYV